MPFGRAPYSQVTVTCSPGRLVRKMEVSHFDEQGWELWYHAPASAFIRITHMNKTLSPASRLREEFSEKQALFNAQPVIVQRFIEAQARQVAEALIERQPQVKFTLPDRIVAETPQIDQPATITVPAATREPNPGGFRHRLTRGDIKEELRHPVH